MQNTLEIELTNLYKEFFSKHNINCESGLKQIENKSKQNENKFVRFATYPFIWKKYWTENKPKILFVWLDIWKDEKQNIQNFDERYSSIINQPYNSHKSWTYIYSAFFLKNNLFEQFDNILHSSFIKAYKDIRDNVNFNPLDYVCLTNFYKFVTEGRKGRSWWKDRKFYIWEKEEMSLFIKEIEIFKPDKIVFQSNTFSDEFIQKVDESFENKKTENKNLYIPNVIKTYHPSKNLSNSNNEFGKGKNSVFVHFQQSHLLD